MLSVTDIQGGMTVLTLLSKDRFCGSGGQLLGPGQNSVSNELFKNDILKAQIDEKNSESTNGAVTTGCPHAKQRTSTPTL